MRKDQIIRAQAHRKLRHLRNYLISGRSELPGYVQEISLEKNEEILGVYENFPGDSNEGLILTTQGIYVNLESWRQFLFERIECIETPSVEEKHFVSHLTLHLKSGEQMQIPIRGGKGRLRDVWAFVSFFNRVLTPATGGSSKT